jgi:hypothetical protein
MYSHGRSCGRGPHLHEVACLVGDPQTVVFTFAWRAAANKWVVGDSVIDHLTDQVVGLTKDPDGAPGGSSMEAARCKPLNDLREVAGFFRS